MKIDQKTNMAAITLCKKMARTDINEGRKT